ncbi:MAG: methyltransferase [Corynebacterium sp.]|nr:methyltransferase [Corynebacterium sp.]
MSLTDVQQNLFSPLFGRAAAAQKWPECFSDPWALEVTQSAENKGAIPEEMEGFTAMVYGLRHLMAVAEVKRYLDSHPGAAVVNMGSGFGQLARDLTDYECTVYNLDTSDTLALRKDWFSDEGVDLPFAITDHAWMDQVDGSKGFIAVAAGRFHYLEVEDVEKLVDAMARKFPGGRLCYDSESPRVIASGQARRRALEDAPMPFKVEDPFEIRNWSNNVRDVDVEFNFTNYLDPEKREVLPFGYRAGFNFFELTKGMYLVKVDFK